MKTVLVIAFHFPPILGSSGFLRTLKFSRYLPGEGWTPVILSVNPRAYENVDSSQLEEIPPDIHVIRAFACDIKRHLAFRGRYPQFLALPDRWASWCLGGVFSGLRAMRRSRVDLIYTTYPIATAVLIGYMLHIISGKPWVVDLRDSMIDDSYPVDIRTRRIYRWIEQKAIRHGSRILFTAESTRKMYLERYPGISETKCILVPNGYDEEDFRGLTFPVRAPIKGRPMRLLHSGIIYPEDRDPRPFFRALARLKKEGIVCADTLRVDLRAAGSEDLYSRVIKELDIEDMVHFLPMLSYRQSLQDCARADALLIFQSATCNHQIPAKVYEYLRLGKPILALTPDRGDTASLLRETGGGTIVDISDEMAIKDKIPVFMESVFSTSHPLPDEEKARRYSRGTQASILGRTLDAVLLEGKGRT